MGMKRKKRAPRRRGWLLGSSATQVICISFVLLIALGTLLLTLPISSRSGRLGVVDAMFTATSATCVTGLVVRDTWTQFTPFGQAVVLLLIQVGGLGLVTLTSFFALAAKRRMGFKDLRLLGESVSASGYSQATDVLKIVVKLAMTFEIIGMVLLMIAFVPQFGAEGIWISAFTAISAFCNAGFDLFGRFGQYSSLAPYVSNYYVQAVIMFLIMAGGLGFMVWVELCQWYQKRRLSLHAKVVLSFSVILWLGGALGLVLWGVVAHAWLGYEPDYLSLALAGLATNAIGQLGDLSMSLIKREVGVKDYSHIFLTHGGILDRYDYTLFIAHWMYMFVCAGL